MAVITFGPFTFNTATARLSRDNVEIRLRPQGIQVLRVLLQHRGQSIGYEQMIAEAWQGIREVDILWAFRAVCAMGAPDI